ncbi:hypothetical protein ADICEAN_03999 [Cesiribacter andamanensis AMV16]|uniref:Uncharacterized protein n=1 Tax=Cesiribacter andamanensis AMV16 TaxID=1279009 RepID=M7NGC5_9BACT|nr:hypothetical protein ADICEAN_03999 [Cesiribacter andamanensis AMV16]
MYPYSYYPLHITPLAKLKVYYFVNQLVLFSSFPVKLPAPMYSSH